jgi:hypothetical protein
VIFGVDAEHVNILTSQQQHQRRNRRTGRLGQALGQGKLTRIEGVFRQVTKMRDLPNVTQEDFDALVRLVGRAGNDGFAPVSDHDWFFYRTALRKWHQASAIRLIENPFERGFFVLGENGQDLRADSG